MIWLVAQESLLQVGVASAGKWKLLGPKDLNNPGTEAWPCPLPPRLPAPLHYQGNGLSDVLSLTQGTHSSLAEL